MRRAALALAAGALAVLAVRAGADSVGGIHFRPPAEWAACADGRGLCAASGGARIVITSPAAGEPAALARKQAVGTIAKDEPLEIGGHPAHLVLAGDDKQIVVVVAVDAGGGVVVTLSAPPGEAPAAFHAWFAVVMSATFGDAPAPPADATPRPFKARNAQADCTANMYVDGKAYQVPPSGVVELALAPGKHVVEWKERDGADRAAAIDVPPAEELAGSCEPPAPPAAMAAAPSAPADELAGVFAGARDAVMYYRTLWNLVLDAEPWPEPKSLDRLMLKLVAARAGSARAELAAYTGRRAALDRAVQRQGGDPAGRTRLRRLAAELLIAVGQITAPKTCALEDAATPEAREIALDCVLARFGRMGVDGTDTMNERFMRLASAEPPPAALQARVEELGK